MTCDRELRHARSLDRRRCERADNPVTERPDPDWLLSQYATRPAPVIADELGVTEQCLRRWIGYARERHIYKQRMKQVRR